MAKRTVTVRGMDKLRAKMGALPRHVNAAARRTVRQETTDVANDMREHAPVLSGKLKEGIQTEYDDKAIEGRAVSTAPHTEYVVHGTSKQSAQDFMTPAAVRSQRRFRRRLTRELDAEIRGKL